MTYWTLALHVREKILEPHNRETRGARRGLAAAYRALGRNSEARTVLKGPVEPKDAPAHGKPAKPAPQPLPGVALSPFWEQLITDALMDIPGINNQAVRAQLGEGVRTIPPISRSTEVDVKNLVVDAGAQRRQGLDRLLANADKLGPKPWSFSGFDPRRWGKRAVNQVSPFARWRKRLDEIIAWPPDTWHDSGQALRDRPIRAARRGLHGPLREPLGYG